MEQHGIDWLKELLRRPGVSGFETEVQAAVRDYVEPFADRVTTDLHGNVIACINPDAPLRVMLPGHCDQLGLVVSHIDERGFVYFQTVGGWDPQQLVGQRVSVWGAKGAVPGVVARKAIHLLSAEERTQVADINRLWIDIGATDRADAESVVAIADAVTLMPGDVELRHGIITAPALDNRSGVWVVMEALRRAREAGATCGVYAVSTVAEEIGLRGARTSAFGIDPQIGVAVDVTHSTDVPDSDQRQRGDISLGGGPVIAGGPNVNVKVREALLEAASAREIPVQLAALGKAASNDASPLQITRAGVATGLVQIPLRYMHSGVEMVALADLDQAATVLGEFTAKLTSADAFVP